jgi:peptidoglycan/LPS O-acetylase OafA/YrhL
MIPVCLTMGWLFTKIARPWFLLYLRNWRGPDATSDGLLGHLWSLAVEEQFYLAWAFVIFFLSRRNLWRLTVTLLAAGPLIRLWLHCESISGYMIFRVTPARMDALLMGALIAMAFRDGIDLAPAAKAGATAGIAALCVLPPDVNVLKTQIFLPSATSILFGSCLVLAVEYRPAWLHSRRWARIAQYSYSMYVIHLLVAVWVFSVAVAIGLPPRTVALPLAVLCVYAVASLLWRVIERPAFRIRDRHFVLQRSLGTPNEATQALAGSTTERAI